LEYIDSKAGDIVTNSSISSEAGSIIHNPTVNFNSYTSDDGVITLTFIDYNCGDENSRYQKRLDLNLDGAINFEDICIIVKHFNNSSENYQ
jgi:hypothetical protein